MTNFTKYFNVAAFRTSVTKLKNCWDSAFFQFQDQRQVHLPQLTKGIPNTRKIVHFKRHKQVILAQRDRMLALTTVRMTTATTKEQKE